MASTGTSTRRAEADGHCDIRRSVMRDNTARFLLATIFALGGYPLVRSALRQGRQPCPRMEAVVAALTDQKIACGPAQNRFRGHAQDEAASPIRYQRLTGEARR